MRFIANIFLTMLAVTAAGQTYDFDFYPGYAVPQGGTEIQIVANGSVRFVAPQVFFGGVPSPHVTLVDSKTIKALAPAHAVGVVILTILDNGALLTSARDFAFAPELEQIIFPIAIQAIDASHGTRWMSDISVYNDSDQAVPIDPEICFDIVRLFDCSQSARRIPPHSSMRIEPWSTSADYPWMILRPPADLAGRLHFSSRLRELSRDPDGPGTEMPVLRSRDFQQNQVWLASVPTNGRFRSTLRVFTRGYSVVVRVRDAATGELLSEREIPRFFPTDSDPFGTVTLNDLFSPAVRARETVRIEVESTSPVWALLTLTENETQRVQIFTPQ
ncbi:MAG: hypothetical protein QOC81_234 [Thermoanaerobaculia bacterium]|jgi:hypothetical protein|nr:hypothetical protein [Thermoanaerobaculia bacterium]